MMKKLMSLALAFTFVFVGANAAFAAPYQPTDDYSPVGETPAFSHDVEYTQEDCVDCHDPSTASGGEAHANHNFLYQDGNGDCAPCHGTSGPEDGDADPTDGVDAGGPGNAAKVECGMCHETQNRSSWERTFASPTAHKGGYDTNNDGVNDAQKPCEDCHTNLDASGAAEEYMYSGTFADLGIDGQVEVVEYEGDDIASIVGVNPTAGVDSHKADPEGEVVTTDNGSTLFIDNKNLMWTYTPAAGLPVGTQETFMIEGDSAVDGSAYAVELTITYLDPTLDQDGDGILNGDESTGSWNDTGYTSDPTLKDTDGDGTEDKAEVSGATDGFVTDPRNPDTDEDGLNDTDEILVGTNPLVQDTDLDGALDGDDYAPLDPAFTLADQDNDGLTNEEEATLGTDPKVADTDKDGVLDGADKYPLDPTKSEDPNPNPNPNPNPSPNPNPKPETKPSGTNPETAGQGIMLAAGTLVAAGAGLVVSRKRK